MYRYFMPDDYRLVSQTEHDQSRRGKKFVLSKLREEALELADACAEWVKGDDSNEKQRSHAVEEMADVAIMIQRARIVYGIDDEEWNLYTNFKIHRQQLRAEREIDQEKANEKSVAQGD